MEQKNLVTVVVIDTRSKEHPDWVEMCKQSILNQSVRCQLIVVENTERDKTIGKCWNEAVKQAEGNWVFFVGDDCWIARDCVQVMMGHVQEGKPCVTTYMTMFENDEYRIVMRPCTGMWEKDYLLKHPFNEELNSGIDREYVQEVIKRGDNYVLVGYYFGHYDRRHDKNTTKKLVFKAPPKAEIYVTCTANVAFVTPLVKEWRKTKDVFIANQPFDPNIESDIIWCEWGTENAVKVGDHDTKAKKFLRIHAYEAFLAYIHYIDFKKYEKVFFIAEHIKRYVESKVGKIPNAVVVPVGVDLSQFTIGKNKDKKKVAFAGEISRKKGAGELILIANSFPEFQFHVAGKFNEDDTARFFNENKPKNIILEPYSYNLNKFFEDKSFILNTSLREGNPVTVMEGMACGLKPIVNNWIGAKEIYRDNVYKNIQDISDLLYEYHEPEHYRKFIEDNFSFDKTVEKINEYISSKS